MTTGFSRDDRLVVVDTALDGGVTEIKVGEEPRGVAISKDGRYAYVANSESESVSVIDVANNAETTAVQVGNSPQDVVLSPNGRSVYVIDPSAATFAVIDTSSNLVATTPPAGAGATAMAMARTVYGPSWSIRTQTPYR